MRWLPPLNALRSFEAVGRLRNVKEAAWELNVSPAAVNHQIRLLEQHLGVDLFARTRTGLVLTADGQKFFNHVAFALDHVMDGYRQVGDHAGRNRLVIEAPFAFATGYILPRLGKFHAENPDLLLEVNGQVAKINELNFAEGTVDLSIRAGTARSVWQGLYAEKLIHSEVMPLCSPALLKGPMPLKTPSDLAHHTLLIATSAAMGWEEWIAEAEARGHDMSNVDTRRGMYFNHISMSATVAQSGFGVDLGRTPMCYNYLKDGSLVAPFDLKVVGHIAYWLVCPKKTVDSHPVQIFRKWLQKELADDARAHSIVTPAVGNKTSPKLKLV